MTDFIDMTKAQLAAVIGGMTASQIKKTSHADLVQMAGEKARVPAAPKARKPRELPDRVMLEPGKPEDVKATKAGSKRHLMAEALAKGATIEELMERLEQGHRVVRAAHRHGRARAGRRAQGGQILPADAQGREAHPGA